MGEVLVVSKGMETLLPVRVDWTIASFELFFRAMAPVFRCYWIVNF